MIDYWVFLDAILSLAHPITSGMQEDKLSANFISYETISNIAGMKVWGDPIKPASRTEPIRRLIM